MKQERNAKCACGSGIKYKKCCLPVKLEKARLDKLEKRRLWLERAELHPSARGSIMDPVMLALATAIHGPRFRA